MYDSCHFLCLHVFNAKMSETHSEPDSNTITNSVILQYGALPTNYPDPEKQ